MTNLALFDFDGTLTHADTFTPFVLSSVSARRMTLGKGLLSPWIAGYKLRLVKGTTLRMLMLRVAFQGRQQEEIAGLGETYARERLPGFVKANALARLRWHQAQGDHVVIVSASLNAYLAPWCKTLGVDLICTELEAAGGLLSGRAVNGDCTGEEKARRVRARYELSRYSQVYAYGDTPEDAAMLRLASRRFYRWPGLEDSGFEARRD